jgi:hypothetical protein
MILYFLLILFIIIFFHKIILLYRNHDKLKFFLDCVNKKKICKNCNTPYLPSVHNKIFINGRYVGCANNKNIFYKNKSKQHLIMHLCNDCGYYLTNKKFIIVHKKIYILGIYICCVDNNNCVTNKDINAIDKYGNNILNNVIWYSKSIDIKNLLKRGAKQIINAKGISTFDLAIIQKNMETVDLLIEYGFLKNNTLKKYIYNKDKDDIEYNLMCLIDDYVDTTTTYDFIQKIKLKHKLL